MSVRPLAAAIGFSTSLVFVVALPAQSSCQGFRAYTLDDLAPGALLPDHDQEVLGVFEREHLAEAPSLGVVGGRSISVVTRYWGEPPPNVSLELHMTSMGLLDLSWPCHGGGGHVGRVDYGWVGGPDAGESRVATHIPKTVFGLGQDDRVTADQEDALSERFGPPVIVGASTSERLGGTLFLWRHYVAMAPAALLAVAALVLPSRRRRVGYTFNPVVVGIAAAVLCIVTVAVSDFGILSWVGIGFAVAAGFAWLSRSVMAVLAAGLAADWLLNAAFDPGSDDYLYLGVLALVLGGGVLVWAGEHWSRWPAGFAIVAGAYLVAGGWEAGFVPDAFLWAVMTAGVVWATAFYYTAKRQKAEPLEQSPDAEDSLGCVQCPGRSNST